MRLARLWKYMQMRRFLDFFDAVARGRACAQLWRARPPPARLPPTHLASAPRLAPPRPAPAPAPPPQATPGFVAVDPPKLEELLAAARATTLDGSLDAAKPHFALVNRQLSTLRALFGLATALGRPAVLPPLWAAQDRWWAPHSGIIPGSDLELPFQCPADHVLDLEA
jgi:hypothetical protein